MVANKTKKRKNEKTKIQPNIAEELYKRNVELAVTNKTLSLLRKLYQISLATVDPQQFHQEVSESILKELNLEIAGVLIFNPNTNSLVPLGFAKSKQLADELNQADCKLSEIEINKATTHKFFKQVVLTKKQNTTNNLLDVWCQTSAEVKSEKIDPDGHVKTFVASPLLNDKGVFAVLLLGMNRDYKTLSQFEKDSIANLTDVVAVGLDRTYIYRELQEANEKLKSLDKLKSEFLSLASHQLRTPLTAIKGYSAMLLEGDFGKIEDKVKGAVDRIMKSSMNLSTMVEDFLNVSKIEQGGMKYVKEVFDLDIVTSTVAKDLSIIAKEKGLQFSYQKDDLNHNINGDKEKIRQVVINFIDNAIKYTKQGSIDVKLENKNGKVRFSVTDTGMGMSPESKAKLFQKFSRAEGGKVNTGGSGLGLYLAKEIIGAHGGIVGVDSPGSDKGSTFYLELVATNSDTK